jgi:hypothetical protein
MFDSGVRRRAEHLLQLRWRDGFRCPHCGCRESSPVRTYRIQYLFAQPAEVQFTMRQHSRGPENG